MKLTLLLLLGGCALTSKATPIDLRYFSPETNHHAVRTQSTRSAIRIGRITSSANLRSRIVHRDSAVEIGEYETLRWTENPETYVRRALSRALFEDAGFEQGLGPSLPTLDIELVGFEEVRMEGLHKGRIQLRYVLHDETAVLASGWITVERDAAPGIEPFVVAIGEAMDQAAGDVSQTVATHFRAIAATNQR